MKIEKLDEVRHILTMQCNLECLHCYLLAGGCENKRKIRLLVKIFLITFI